MDTDSLDRIRFDDFEVDQRAGELLRDGEPVRIQPQPFRVLKFLLEHPGQTVTREQLRQHIWGGATYVEFDQGLNYCIRQIRVALGDNAANPVYVETLPKQGYRFIGCVAQPNPIGFQNGAVGLRAETVSDLPNHQEQTPVAPSRLVAEKRAVWITAIVLCGIGAAAISWIAIPHKPQITSVAVLPLDNLSGDPMQDYFADGITDELTTILAETSKLRVVSRTSAMQYKRAHRPLREIAQGLGVNGIIEGSVARANDRIHMTVQLIDARSDTHIWAEDFDRDRSESASLTREVAQLIAARLSRAMSPAASARYVNPEAHDDYLHGRYLWFTGHDHEAREYFEKATQLQSDYALAWTGLADSYAAGAVDGIMDPRDSLWREKAAARRAVSLDDSLAEAHLSLCAAAYFADWNWQQALTECGRAIELDPELAEAHHFRSKILSSLNRHAEAIQSERRAMELSPFARPYALASTLNKARQYDAAIADARARLESTPANFGLLRNLEDGYRRKGMGREAANAAERALQADGHSAMAEAVAQAFEHGGYRSIVRMSLDYWTAARKRRYVSPVVLSGFTAELQQREQTLVLLEQGYEERSPYLLKIQLDPAYDFLHSDERYRSIIKKVGLPPAY